MTREEFWKIIEASRSDWDSSQASGNQERQVRRLKEVLSALPAEEIAAYSDHFSALMDAAYHWDLWGAAYLIEGGCSDDGFYYFRNWLISMGQAVYEAALTDAETLAEVAARPDIEIISFEEFGYAADEVYREKIGTEMPPSNRVHPKEPAGDPWYNKDDDGEAELARRFPKLSAAFEDLDDEEDEEETEEA